MLELSTVVSSYGPVRALSGVDLTVPEGSLTAVLGANGAGKTTLLRTASGLVAPASGSIVFDGRDVTGFTNTYAFGMAQAYTFAEALKLAGRDLTRGKLVDAMASGKLKGPGLTPFGFSKQSHSGYTGAYVFKINPDTTTTEIQPPMVTDRGDGDITAAPAERSTPQDIGLG